MSIPATSSEECARPRTQQRPQAKDASRLEKDCPLLRLSMPDCFRLSLRPRTGALQALPLPFSLP